MSKILVCISQPFQDNLSRIFVGLGVEGYPAGNAIGGLVRRRIEFVVEEVEWDSKFIVAVVISLSLVGDHNVSCLSMGFTLWLIRMVTTHRNPELKCLLSHGSGDVNRW